jgi:hypothetical protein
MVERSVPEAALTLAAGVDRMANNQVRNTGSRLMNQR